LLTSTTEYASTEKDAQKNILCQQNGIKIIRVRESGCSPLVKNDYCKGIHILPNNREDLSRVLGSIGKQEVFAVDYIILDHR